MLSVESQWLDCDLQALYVVFSFVLLLNNTLWHSETIFNGSGVLKHSHCSNNFVLSLLGYVGPRNLPSTGFFPFLQTLMCNTDSNCRNKSYLVNPAASKSAHRSSRAARYCYSYVQSAYYLTCTAEMPNAYLSHNFSLHLLLD